MILGKLKRLDVFVNLPINYGQSYIYARGAVIQDLLRADFRGNPIYEVVDLGQWSASAQYIRGLDTDASRYVQHQVWYGNCCWRCAADKSTIGKAPRWNNTEWVCVVGDSNFRLEIASSAGYMFRYGRENTTLSFNLYHGSTDISVDASSVAWTRESGLAEEDKSWAILHKDDAKTCVITPSDMPSNWKTTRSVLFRCTVSIKDGKSLSNNIKIN